MTPIITLEEHYINAEVAAKSGTDYSLFPEQLVSKLGALGQTRIDDMDASNISMQILSHAPIDASLSQSIEANDQLASAISKNPTRLAGFALLPMAEPEAAADELTRCVKEMGFVGALLDNHLDGVFYDDEKFWPVFAKAEELDVPLYLHPTFASERMMEGYRGNYGEKEALALSAFGWGWHSETALHVLKLFAAGLFDRFPRLKIVIGHMGELLPFQLDRVIKVTQRWGKSGRGLQEVWDTNIYITTSGMFSLPPLSCLLQVAKIDHIMFSVDYPFSTNETGKEFLEEIRGSGLMSEVDFGKFAYGNAEALLGIKAVAG